LGDHRDPSRRFREKGEVRPEGSTYVSGHFGHGFIAEECDLVYQTAGCVWDCAKRLWCRYREHPQFPQSHRSCFLSLSSTGRPAEPNLGVLCPLPIDIASMAHRDHIFRAAIFYNSSSPVEETRRSNPQIVENTQMSWKSWDRREHHRNETLRMRSRRCRSGVIDLVHLEMVTHLLLAVQ
jgi:hypothetical protein